MTEEAVDGLLANRPRTGRNQADDNNRLAPLSSAINQAIANGDLSLAARVFRENYPKILAYEAANPPCEIHKGALAFDVARAYLQSWDFFAAMHYFELAQHETQITTADPNFSIYTFALFENNFWDAVHANAAAHPIPIYQEFWGVTYNKQSALQDYADLSPEIKLAYIIATAERVRLQNIADHSGWEGSKALRLGIGHSPPTWLACLKLRQRDGTSQPQGQRLRRILQSFPVLKLAFQIRHWAIFHTS
ncbi:hypothetical protein [Fimbriiglobus ruber]|uniref:hypothetical protein n=1 Tax=Fimbriiglobus ruber TaxID=1908690 RepID=UPI00137B2561|nr:hypothetical protein [Fimbriiglobus ruber]